MLCNKWERSRIHLQGNDGNFFLRKVGRNMAKKKQGAHPISQEDSAQAQQVFEQYHQVAGELHASKDQKQVEAALSAINAMSEGAQLVLLKTLAKERHTDAADILVALNESSSLKNIRKEAKRSLIQLEGGRIYPHWKPPVERTPVIQLTGNPPRFWKGLVTDSRDVGEVHLLLCWEQGDEYKDVRVLGFLLEFWHDGVKDFFTRVESKQRFEKFAAQMAQEMPDVQIKPCSLAEGRRLIQEALDVNARHGTLPYKDYRVSSSLLNELIFSAPDLEDEDIASDEEEEEDDELRGLSPNEVVMRFVESWCDGDYDAAYELLTSDSPLREGLSPAEWVQRREDWLDAANPDELEPGYIYEHEPQKSKLWLPRPFSTPEAPERKEIEAGWSLEFDETPLSDTLPELPRALLTYEETGRHWFWVSYTLVQEEGEWRIQHMTEEAPNALQLPVAELEQRIQEHNKQIEEIAKKHPAAEPDAAQYIGDVIRHALQAANYTDVLIQLLPGNRAIYEQAASRMLILGQLERCAVYLELLTQRFEEQRAQHLRILAQVQQQLSDKYFDLGDDEWGERHLELAEEALNESLAIEGSAAGHISLAELLIEDDRLDEAEDHLLRAKALTTDPADEAHIEMHLGEVATEREQYEEALLHYQRAAELEPGYPDTWVDLARAYERLDNLEEAEANYRHAIALEPDDEDLYYALSKMYAEHGQPEKAIEAIEDGLDANPDSAVLSAYLAIMYLEKKDYRQAEIFLDRAERLDPELEMIPTFRQILRLEKAQSAPAPTIDKTESARKIGKLSRSKSKKKRR